jgi:hypothetical protein
MEMEHGKICKVFDSGPIPFARKKVGGGREKRGLKIKT